MKRYILTLLIGAGISSIAAAQTSGSNSSNSPTVSNTTAPQSTKSKKGAKANNVQIDSLNDRKVYHWKDGQKATPTGHEATGLGGGYAALTPDTTAVLARDSTRRQ